MKTSLRILILGMATFWAISGTAGAGQDKDERQDRLPKLQDLSKNMLVRLVSVKKGAQRLPIHYLRFVTIRTNVQNLREFEVRFIPRQNPHEETLLNVILGCVDLNFTAIRDEPHKATLTLILSMPQDADEEKTNDHSTWFVRRLGPLEKEEK